MSLTVAVPAVAAHSAQCQITSWSCVSAAIPPDSSNAVYYQVQAGGPRCYYTVRDVANGVPVASGSTTGLSGRKRVGGLYSHYRIELSSGSEQALYCYGVISS